MIILEAVLLTVLLLALIRACYTDCKTSQIRNKLVLLVSIIAIPLDCIYYIVFARELALLFLINLAIILLISFFFYTYHLWAAGDSKLFFVAGLCIPARFYTYWDIGNIPSFAILIFIFSTAFLYVVAESVILGIKNKNLFKFSVGEVDYSYVAISYFAMVSASTLVNWIVWRFFEEQLNRNLILPFAVSFFTVLTLIQIRNRIGKRGLFIMAIAGWTLVLLLIVTRQLSLSGGFDWRSWIVVLVVMAFRMISEKYNYQAIPTSSIKVGQILSVPTIIGFKPSRVQGLPTGMTEDLRSRITEEEAESIKRWESSKYGKPYVIIVRKIPFAIFITIGTIAFLALEVAMI